MFYNPVRKFLFSVPGSQNSDNHQSVDVHPNNGVMYNLASKEGILGTKKYPFGGRKGNHKKISSGNKIGLTTEEISRIEVLKLEEGTSIWHTRNIWLFAYYFAGVRVSDVVSLK